MTKQNSLITRIIKKLPFIGKSKPIVSVLELRGAIGISGPGGRSISHKSLEKTIEEAFKPSSLEAVALAINSPGGSPVQSRLIQRTIRRHAEKKGIPVYAFIEDVGASGGYLLALAADEIYADTSSIVGSIGVISAGFGFQEAIAKIGIERRVYTSGQSKSQLDPFKEENPKDIARLSAILEETHQHFESLVRERRKKVLGNQDDIFTGAFWTAQAAQERGLIDGQAHLIDFIKEKYGEDAKIKKSATNKGLIKMLTNSKKSDHAFHVTDDGIIAAGADRVIEHLENRSLWARFGL